MKKTKRLFGLFFMVFTLLAGSLSVFANSEIEEKYGISQSQIDEAVEGWITQLLMLSDEELEQYKSTGDEMVSTWMDISEGIGGFVEVLGDKATYEVTEEGFIGEVPVKMENKEILVKLDFSAISGAVDVTFSEEGAGGGLGLLSILKKAGINTLIGMGTVFCMLIFISLLIWLLGFVPKLFSGKKEEKTTTPAPTAAPVAEQIAERETAKTDDQELVAVIAAAIAAATGTSTDSFVVRSIRKVKRS